MKVLVTGAAGFIGSHLSERLVKMGYQVRGIDSFTPYYPREYKEDNIVELKNSKDFDFIEGDILNVDVLETLHKVDYVFHLAAQPGVRASWSDFETYSKHNLRATHRLLEGCKKAKPKLFVFTSSSSVYGDAESYPTSERLRPMPISPYGVTKMAAERLCELYYKYYQIPTVILRYFTVYGPRQRPDMALYRFIENLLINKEIVIYGDGNQARDFTYISDIVDGTVNTLEHDVIGETINLGRGEPVSINEALKTVARFISNEPKIRFEPPKEGDALRTCADIKKAKELLKYEPKVALKDGIELQVRWQRSRLNKQKRVNDV